ncbi:MAG: hypothetical protein A2031_02555 [Deltaproteobacteria bacterium RBG_19FT_COMBO_43_11]|nr:MAG: hypothetical protein A2031_02555 [Deltaproteobacteria bacterium RBG_19FT_COMBO_43_11]
MKRWLFISMFFIILGCGDQPSSDMIRADFQKVYPKAEIVLINPVDKSSDTYRINISYRPDTSYLTETSGQFREDEFLYKKINGKWVNTWRRSSGK